MDGDDDDPLASPRPGQSFTRYYLFTVYSTISADRPISPVPEAREPDNRAATTVPEARDAAVLRPRTPQPTRPAPSLPQVTAKSAPTSPKPLPQPQAPPAPQATSTAEQAHTPLRETVPLIHLERPTPQSLDVQERRQVQGMSAPASPTPQHLPEIRPGSPNSQIHIPQTGDAAMQRFFHDIVDQLSTMSSGRPTSVMSSSTGTSGPRSPNTPLSPSPELNSSPFFADPSRFEDAEEDSQSPVLSPPRSHASPQVSPRLPTAPGRVPSPAFHPGSRRSARSPVEPLRPAPRPPHGASSAPVVPTRSARPASQMANKENVSMARPPLRPSPATQPTGLGIGTGLGIQSPGADMFGGLNSSMKSDSKPSKSKSKGWMYCPFDVRTTAYPPCLGTSPGSSPRTPEPLQVARSSWFANLFNWKQLVSVFRCLILKSPR